MKKLGTAALAVVGGVAWALCFGSQAMVWLPWLALTPLIQLSRQRHAFLLGWAHGIVYWLVAIHWIIGTLESYGGLSPALAVASLGLLSAYLGIYHAVFAALGFRIWKRRPSAVVWALPALWVGLEVVRARLLSGFPWNLAAYSAIEVPGVLVLSSWIGAYGISFLVVAGNVAVLLLILRQRVWRVATVLVAIVLVLITATFGAEETVSRASGRAVRVVQPNTPILTEWDSEQVLAGYRQLLTLTDQACEAGALVIWPESAAWPYVLDRDPRLSADLARFNERGCTVIVNSISREGEEHFNSAYLAAPGGKLERYDKRHLVPFGEYVPLRRLFPFLRRLARAAGDFSPGAETRQLNWENERLGMAICFEVVFPGEVAARVRDGATVLVTITNDAWYGDTAAPWQHFRAARFRAAENRRPLVRAALTGISGFVSERGAIESWLDVGEQGVLDSSVSGGRQLTFYTRWPWLVPALCGLLLGFAILRPARARETVTCCQNEANDHDLE